MQSNKSFERYITSPQVSNAVIEIQPTFYCSTLSKHQHCRGTELNFADTAVWKRGKGEQTCHIGGTWEDKRYRYVSNLILYRVKFYFELFDQASFVANPNI